MDYKITGKQPGDLWPKVDWMIQFFARTSPYIQTRGLFKFGHKEIRMHSPDDHSFFIVNLMAAWVISGAGIMADDDTVAIDYSGPCYKGVDLQILKPIDLKITIQIKSEGDAFRLLIP